MKQYRIALCGNPNVGKSTVFNVLTGLKQHTGNWSGKTVEAAVGEVHTLQSQWQLIDLPGAYTLFGGSAEEIVASDYLTFEHPDAAIVVCDATRLERNLNLALQIAQACPRTLLCINMLDETEKYGIELELPRLEEMLRLPVVGVSARQKRGMEQLKQRMDELLTQPGSPSPYCFHCPQALRDSVERLCRQIRACCPDLAASFAATRSLMQEDGFCEKLLKYSNAPEQLQKQISQESDRLTRQGLTREKRISAIVAASYAAAREAAQSATRRKTSASSAHQRLDSWMSHWWIGIPVMLGLLGLVLYITLLGANKPAEWLSHAFSMLEPILLGGLQRLHAPLWLQGLLIHGVYRMTTWVVAVMLPPMAIFFPLFTLLEDFGLLPRFAFHLDRCFHCCHSCGKQALCMCMGLGCNAVGVTGCRIIQSPRERLIAILTNALIPCNGRFPALIALVGMFFAASSAAAAGAAWLTLLLLMSIAATLLMSFLLSRTLLRGIPSSFSLELPPFRRPKIGEVLVRSLMDRTLFVLGRAVTAAAPAGVLVWCLANVHAANQSLIAHAALLLDPVGRMIGMDGVILLAFLLGLPANEIVLPMIMMIYQQQGVLNQLSGLAEMKAVLLAHGWTIRTAACVIAFTLFHWPCATTILTIRKETGSAKWTALAVVLPALAGIAICLGIVFLSNLFA